MKTKKILLLALLCLELSIVSIGQTKIDIQPDFEYTSSHNKHSHGQESEFTRFLNVEDILKIIDNASIGDQAKNSLFPIDLEPYNEIMCPGESRTITIDGPINGVSYVWTDMRLSQTVGTGTSITVSPLVTTTYLIFGSNSVSVGYTQFTIIVDNDPLVISNTNNQTICYENEVELCATVGDISIPANWSGPIVPTTNPCINVNIPGLYVANGFSVNGCPVTSNYTIDSCCFDDSDPDIDVINQSNISTLYPSTSGGQYFINGDVSIQTSLLNLNNTSFIVSPETSILVEGSSNVNLTEVEISSACPTMWEGIEIISDAKLEVQHSWIYDAETAILVNSASAGLNVEASFFENNFNGIDFRHSIPHPGIKENKFKSDNSSMKSPHMNKYSNAHILFSHDHTGTWVIDNNVFSNSRYGLFKSESEYGRLSLTASENTFENCFQGGIYIESSVGSGNTEYVVTKGNKFYFPDSIPNIYNTQFSITYGVYTNHNYTSTDDKFYGKWPGNGLNQIGIYHNYLQNGRVLGDVKITDCAFEQLENGINLINANTSGFKTAIERNIFTNLHFSIIFRDNGDFYTSYPNLNLTSNLLSVKCNDFIRDIQTNPGWGWQPMTAIFSFVDNLAPSSPLPSFGANVLPLPPVSETPRNEIDAPGAATFRSIVNFGGGLITYNTYGLNENIGSSNYPVWPLASPTMIVNVGHYPFTQADPTLNNICLATTAGVGKSPVNSEVEDQYQEAIVESTLNGSVLDTEMGISLFPNPSYSGMFEPKNKWF